MVSTRTLLILSFDSATKSDFFCLAEGLPMFQAHHHFGSGLPIAKRVAVCALRSNAVRISQNSDKLAVVRRCSNHP